jgi:pyrroline-5-carboxylate reductase
VERERVIVAARESAQATADALGVRAGTIFEVAARSDVIVLAVKPAQAARMLASLKFELGQLVVSVVAGVARAALPVSPARLVRTMPNIACRVGQGTTAILATADEYPEDVERITRLFEAVGQVVRVPDEGMFHGVTALSGSGPAYLFAAMEALADGAVAAGVPRDLARTLVVHTFRSATALAAAPGAVPSLLKDEVASPGGTTRAGLDAMAAGGDLDRAASAAVRAAVQRARSF